MNLLPAALTLRFNAYVCRRLEAKVALACLPGSGKRYPLALMAIRNRELAVGRQFWKGTLSSSDLCRQLVRLSVLRNQLAGNDGTLGSTSNIYIGLRAAQDGQPHFLKPVPRGTTWLCHGRASPDLRDLARWAFYDHFWRGGLGMDDYASFKCQLTGMAGEEIELGYWPERSIDHAVRYLLRELQRQRPERAAAGQQARLQAFLTRLAHDNPAMLGVSPKPSPTDVSVRLPPGSAARHATTHAMRIHLDTRV